MLLLELDVAYIYSFQTLFSIQGFRLASSKGPVRLFFPCLVRSEGRGRYSLRNVVDILALDDVKHFSHD